MNWPQDARVKAQNLLRKRIELGQEITFMFESEVIQVELAILGNIDAEST